MAKGRMPAAAHAGLQRYGKATKTKDIAKDVDKPGVKDPEALAVWIRKQGLGEAEFKRHQRKKK